MSLFNLVLEEDIKTKTNIGFGREQQCLPHTQLVSSFNAWGDWH